MIIPSWKVYHHWWFRIVYTVGIVSFFRYTGIPWLIVYRPAPHSHKKKWTPGACCPWNSGSFPRAVSFRRRRRGRGAAPAFFGVAGWEMGDGTWKWSNSGIYGICNQWWSVLPSRHLQKTMERSTMLLLGKLTNSLWPCSIANCNELPEGKHADCNEVAKSSAKPRNLTELSTCGPPRVGMSTKK